MKRRQVIGIAVSILVLITVIIILGPLDFFTHGFFCNEIDCSQIAEDDYGDCFDLGEDVYEMTFSPKKRHMIGFEIYLTNQPRKNTGILCMRIFDEKRREVDQINVDLSKVKSESWYKVYMNAELKQGKKYILEFSTKNCATNPALQKVERDYLPDETLTGNILLAYAYANSTFTLQNKIIIFMFLFGAWIFICSCLCDKKKNTLRIIATGIFLTSVLTWNYMYNSMDNQNSTFSGFQAVSETLVTGTIYAEQDGVYFRNSDEYGFGLGQYYDLKGLLNSYELDYITDDNWLDGYSRSDCSIIVNSNVYSKKVVAVGNYIVFDNGEQLQITGVENDGLNIVAHLNSDRVLTPSRNGSLDDAVFYNSEMQLLEQCRIKAYKSQYGLQGKVFKRLARYMDRDEIVANLNLICSIAAAFVFVMIVFLIAMKYNRILAACFFTTFWLSPWIVNFARNLYWVEFTWFLPMLVGLFCSWKLNNRKCRIVSYAGVFFSIFGKCLCGYEYITTVMMGLISFLLVDFVLSIVNKDIKQLKLLLRTIVMVGTIALMGFAAAICVHAMLKGNGNIIEGIKNIFEQDVLRRTVGGDLNNFDAVYWASLNASMWEVYCKYFHFETEVITGIAGNLFPLLCVVPLCIFVCEFRKKKLNVESAAMYCIFFLTSISWFCLGKGHSYIHTHLNYVLWYFGFVQICIYIILNKLVKEFVKNE